MNLTGRPIYQKGQRLKKRGNTPTKKDRERWGLLVSFGCCVAGAGGAWGLCAGRITIHHCGTGTGRQKDHARVIPLCWEHHLGKEGIDGKRMSKRAWQEKYGSETVLLKVTEYLLKRRKHRE